MHGIRSFSKPYMRGALNTILQMRLRGHKYHAPGHAYSKTDMQSPSILFQTTSPPPDTLSNGQYHIELCSLFPTDQKALSLPCVSNSNQPPRAGGILFKGPGSDTGVLSWDGRHTNCDFTVTLKRKCYRWVQKLPGPARYLIFLGQKVVGVSLQFHEMPFELIYLYGAVIQNKTREESYWRNGKMLSPGWVVFQKRIN